MTPLRMMSSRRVAAGVALLTLAVALSACGLAVPDSVSGVLTGTETGPKAHLGLTLFGPGDISGCNGEFDLKLDQSIDKERVTIEIRGHEHIPDDPGTCTSLTDIEGRTELPPVEDGETLRLEILLRDETSIFEIERDEDTVLLTELVAGNVSLNCGAPTQWDLSLACEER